MKYDLKTSEIVHHNKTPANRQLFILLFKMLKIPLISHQEKKHVAEITLNFKGVNGNVTTGV